jgi:hypothetical protein
VDALKEDIAFHDRCRDFVEPWRRIVSTALPGLVNQPAGEQRLYQIKHAGFWHAELIGDDRQCQRTLVAREKLEKIECIVHLSHTHAIPPKSHLVHIRELSSCQLKSVDRANPLQ